VEGYCPLANSKEAGGRHKPLLEEPLLTEIAGKYKKTVA